MQYLHLGVDILGPPEFFFGSFLFFQCRMYEEAPGGVFSIFWFVSFRVDNVAGIK